MATSDPMELLPSTSTIRDALVGGVESSPWASQAACARHVVDLAAAELVSDDPTALLVLLREWHLLAHDPELKQAQATAMWGSRWPSTEAPSPPALALGAFDALGCLLARADVTFSGTAPAPMMKEKQRRGCTAIAQAVAVYLTLTGGGSAAAPVDTSTGSLDDEVKESKGQEVEALAQRLVDALVEVEGAFDAEGHSCASIVATATAAHPGVWWHMSPEAPTTKELLLRAAKVTVEASEAQTALRAADDDADHAGTGEASAARTPASLWLRLSRPRVAGAGMAACVPAAAAVVASAGDILSTESDGTHVDCVAEALESVMGDAVSADIRGVAMSSAASLLRRAILRGPQATSMCRTVLGCARAQMATLRSAEATATAVLSVAASARGAEARAASTLLLDWLQDEKTRDNVLSTIMGTGVADNSPATTVTRAMLGCHAAVGNALSCVESFRVDHSSEKEDPTRDEGGAVGAIMFEVEARDTKPPSPCYAVPLRLLPCDALCRVNCGPNAATLPAIDPLLSATDAGAEGQAVWKAVRYALDRIARGVGICVSDLDDKSFAPAIAAEEHGLTQRWPSDGVLFVYAPDLHSLASSARDGVLSLPRSQRLALLPWMDWLEELHAVACAPAAAEAVEKVCAEVVRNVTERYQELHADLQQVAPNFASATLQREAVEEADLLVGVSPVQVLWADPAAGAADVPWREAALATGLEVQPSSNVSSPGAGGPGGTGDSPMTPNQRWSPVRFHMSTARVTCGKAPVLVLSSRGNATTWSAARVTDCDHTGTLRVKHMAGSQEFLDETAPDGALQSSASSTGLPTVSAGLVPIGVWVAADARERTWLADLATNYDLSSLSIRKPDNDGGLLAHVSNQVDSVAHIVGGVSQFLLRTVSCDFPCVVRAAANAGVAQMFRNMLKHACDSEQASVQDTERSSVQLLQRLQGRFEGVLEPSLLSLRQLGSSVALGPSREDPGGVFCKAVLRNFAEEFVTEDTDWWVGLVELVVEVFRIMEGAELSVSTLLVHLLGVVAVIACDEDACVKLCQGGLVQLALKTCAIALIQLEPSRTGGVAAAASASTVDDPRAVAFGLVEAGLAVVQSVCRWQASRRLFSVGSSLDAVETLQLLLHCVESANTASLASKRGRGPLDKIRRRVAASAYACMECVARCCKLPPESGVVFVEAVQRLSLPLPDTGELERLLGALAAVRPPDATQLQPEDKAKSLVHLLPSRVIALLHPVAEALLTKGAHGGASTTEDAAAKPPFLAGHSALETKVWHETNAWCRYKIRTASRCHVPSSVLHPSFDHVVAGALRVVGERMRVGPVGSGSDKTELSSAAATPFDATSCPYSDEVSKQLKEMGEDVLGDDLEELVAVRVRMYEEDFELREGGRRGLVRTPTMMLAKTDPLKVMAFVRDQLNRSSLTVIASACNCMAYFLIQQFRSQLPLKLWPTQLLAREHVSAIISVLADRNSAEEELVAAVRLLAVLASLSQQPNERDFAPATEHGCRVGQRIPLPLVAGGLSIADIGELLVGAGAAETDAPMQSPRAVAMLAAVVVSSNAPAALRYNAAEVLTSLAVASPLVAIVVHRELTRPSGQSILLRTPTWGVAQPLVCTILRRCAPLVRTSRIRRTGGKPYPEAESRVLTGLLDVAAIAARVGPIDVLSTLIDVEMADDASETLLVHAPVDLDTDKHRSEALCLAVLHVAAETEVPTFTRCAAWRFLREMMQFSEEQRDAVSAHIGVQRLADAVAATLRSGEEAVEAGRHFVAFAEAAVPCVLHLVLHVRRNDQYFTRAVADRLFVSLRHVMRHSHVRVGGSGTRRDLSATTYIAGCQALQALLQCSIVQDADNETPLPGDTIASHAEWESTWPRIKICSATFRAAWSAVGPTSSKKRRHLRLVDVTPITNLVFTPLEATEELDGSPGHDLGPTPRDVTIAALKCLSVIAEDSAHCYDVAFDRKKPISCVARLFKLACTRVSAPDGGTGAGPTTPGASRPGTPGTPLTPGVARAATAPARRINRIPDLALYLLCLITRPVKKGAASSAMDSINKEGNAASESWGNTLAAHLLELFVQRLNDGPSWMRAEICSAIGSMAWVSTNKPRFLTTRGGISVPSVLLALLRKAIERPKSGGRRRSGPFSRGSSMPLLARLGLDVSLQHLMEALLGALWALFGPDTTPLVLQYVGADSVAIRALALLFRHFAMKGGGVPVHSVEEVHGDGNGTESDATSAAKSVQMAELMHDVEDGVAVEDDFPKATDATSRASLKAVAVMANILPGLGSRSREALDVVLHAMVQPIDEEDEDGEEDCAVCGSCTVGSGQLAASASYRELYSGEGPHNKLVSSIYVAFLNHVMHELETHLTGSNVQHVAALTEFCVWCVRFLRSRGIDNPLLVVGGALDPILQMLASPGDSEPDRTMAAATRLLGALVEREGYDQFLHLAAPGHPLNAANLLVRCLLTMKTSMEMQTEVMRSLNAVLTRQPRAVVAVRRGITPFVNSMAATATGLVAALRFKALRKRAGVAAHAASPPRGAAGNPASQEYSGVEVLSRLMCGRDFRRVVMASEEWEDDDSSARRILSTFPPPSVAELERESKSDESGAVDAENRQSAIELFAQVIRPTGGAAGRAAVVGLIHRSGWFKRLLCMLVVDTEQLLTELGASTAPDIEASALGRRVAAQLDMIDQCTHNQVGEVPRGFAALPDDLFRRLTVILIKLMSRSDSVAFTCVRILAGIVAPTRAHAHPCNAQARVHVRNMTDGDLRYLSARLFASPEDLLLHGRSEAFSGDPGTLDGKRLELVGTTARCIRGLCLENSANLGRFGDGHSRLLFACPALVGFLKFAFSDSGIVDAVLQASDHSFDARPMPLLFAVWEVTHLLSVLCRGSSNAVQYVLTSKSFEHAVNGGFVAYLLRRGGHRPSDTRPVSGLEFLHALLESEATSAAKARSGPGIVMVACLREQAVLRLTEVCLTCHRYDHAAKSLMPLSVMLKNSSEAVTQAVALPDAEGVTGIVNLLSTFAESAGSDGPPKLDLQQLWRLVQVEWAAHAVAGISSTKQGMEALISAGAWSALLGFFNDCPTLGAGRTAVIACLLSMSEMARWGVPKNEGGHLADETERAELTKQLDLHERVAQHKSLAALLTSELKGWANVRSNTAKVLFHISYWSGGRAVVSSDGILLPVLYAVKAEAQRAVQYKHESQADDGASMSRPGTAGEGAARPASSAESLRSSPIRERPTTAGSLVSQASATTLSGPVVVSDCLKQLVGALSVLSTGEEVVPRLGDTNPAVIFFLLHALDVLCAGGDVTLSTTWTCLGALGRIARVTSLKSEPDWASERGWQVLVNMMVPGSMLGAGAAWVFANLCQGDEHKAEQNGIMIARELRNSHSFTHRLRSLGPMLEGGIARLAAADCAAALAKTPALACFFVGAMHHVPHAAAIAASTQLEEHNLHLHVGQAMNRIIWSEVLPRSPLFRRNASEELIHNPDDPMPTHVKQAAGRPDARIVSSDDKTLYVARLVEFMDCVGVHSVELRRKIWRTPSVFAAFANPTLFSHLAAQLREVLPGQSYRGRYHAAIPGEEEYVIVKRAVSIMALLFHTAPPLPTAAAPHDLHAMQDSTIPHLFEQSLETLMRDGDTADVRINSARCLWGYVLGHKTTRKLLMTRWTEHFSLADDLLAGMDAVDAAETSAPRPIGLDWVVNTLMARNIDTDILWSLAKVVNELTTLLVITPLRTAQVLRALLSAAHNVADRIRQAAAAEKAIAESTAAESSKSGGLFAVIQRPKVADVDFERLSELAENKPLAFVVEGEAPPLAELEQALEALFVAASSLVRRDAHSMTQLSPTIVYTDEGQLAVADADVVARAIAGRLDPDIDAEEMDLSFIDPLMTMHRLRMMGPVAAMASFVEQLSVHKPGAWLIRRMCPQVAGQLLSVPERRPPPGVKTATTCIRALKNLVEADARMAREIGRSGAFAVVGRLIWRLHSTLDVVLGVARPHTLPDEAEEDGEMPNEQELRTSLQLMTDIAVKLAPYVRLTKWSEREGSWILDMLEDPLRQAAAANVIAGLCSPANEAGPRNVHLLTNGVIQNSWKSKLRRLIPMLVSLDRESQAAAATALTHLTANNEVIIEYFNSPEQGTVLRDGDEGLSIVATSAVAKLLGIEDTRPNLPKPPMIPGENDITLLETGDLAIGGQRVSLLESPDELTPYEKRVKSMSVRERLKASDPDAALEWRYAQPARLQHAAATRIASVTRGWLTRVVYPDRLIKEERLGHPYPVILKASMMMQRVARSFVARMRVAEIADQREWEKRKAVRSQWISAATEDWQSTPGSTRSFRSVTRGGSSRRIVVIDPVVAGTIPAARAARAAGAKPLMLYGEAQFRTITAEMQEALASLTGLLSSLLQVEKSRRLLWAQRSFHETCVNGYIRFLVRSVGQELPQKSKTRRRASISMPQSAKQTGLSPAVSDAAAEDTLRGPLKPDARAVDLLCCLVRWNGHEDLIGTSNVHSNPPVAAFAPDGAEDRCPRVTTAVRWPAESIQKAARGVLPHVQETDEYEGITNEIPYEDLYGDDDTLPFERRRTLRKLRLARDRAHQKRMKARLCATYAADFGVLSEAAIVVQTGVRGWLVRRVRPKRMWILAKYITGSRATSTKLAFGSHSDDADLATASHSRISWGHVTYARITRSAVQIQRIVRGARARTQLHGGGATGALHLGVEGLCGSLEGVAGSLKRKSAIEQCRSRRPKARTVSDAALAAGAGRADGTPLDVAFSHVAISHGVIERTFQVLIEYLEHADVDVQEEDEQFEASEAFSPVARVAGPSVASPQAVRVGLFATEPSDSTVYSANHIAACLWLLRRLSHSSSALKLKKHLVNVRLSATTTASWLDVLERLGRVNADVVKAAAAAALSRFCEHPLLAGAASTILWKRRALDHSDVRPAQAAATALTSIGRAQLRQWHTRLDLAPILRAIVAAEDMVSPDWMPHMATGSRYTYAHPGSAWPIEVSGGVARARAPEWSTVKGFADVRVEYTPQEITDADKDMPVWQCTTNTRIVTRCMWMRAISSICARSASLPAAPLMATTGKILVNCAAYSDAERTFSMSLLWRWMINFPDEIRSLKLTPGIVVPLLGDAAVMLSHDVLEAVAGKHSPQHRHISLISYPEFQRVLQRVASHPDGSIAQPAAQLVESVAASASAVQRLVSSMPQVVSLSPLRTSGTPSFAAVALRRSLIDIVLDMARWPSRERGELMLPRWAGVAKRCFGALRDCEQTLSSVLGVAEWAYTHWKSFISPRASDRPVSLDLAAELHCLQLDAARAVVGLAVIARHSRRRPFSSLDLQALLQKLHVMDSLKHITKTIVEPMCVDGARLLLPLKGVEGDVHRAFGACWAPLVSTVHNLTSARSAASLAIRHHQLSTIMSVWAVRFEESERVAIKLYQGSPSLRRHLWMHREASVWSALVWPILVGALASVSVPDLDRDHAEADLADLSEAVSLAWGLAARAPAESKDEGTLQRSPSKSSIKAPSRKSAKVGVERTPSGRRVRFQDGEGDSGGGFAERKGEEDSAEVSDRVAVTVTAQDGHTTGASAIAVDDNAWKFAMLATPEAQARLILERCRMLDAPDVFDTQPHDHAMDAEAITRWTNNHPTMSMPAAVASGVFAFATVWRARLLVKTARSYNLRATAMHAAREAEAQDAAALRRRVMRQEFDAEKAGEALVRLRGARFLSDWNDLRVLHSLHEPANDRRIIERPRSWRADVIRTAFVGVRDVETAFGIHTLKRALGVTNSRSILPTVLVLLLPVVAMLGVGVAITDSGSPETAAALVVSLVSVVIVLPVVVASCAWIRSPGRHWNVDNGGRDTRRRVFDFGYITVARLLLCAATVAEMLQHVSMAFIVGANTYWPDIGLLDMLGGIGPELGMVFSPAGSLVLAAVLVATAVIGVETLNSAAADARRAAAASVDARRKVTVDLAEGAERADSDSDVSDDDDERAVSAVMRGRRTRPMLLTAYIHACTGKRNANKPRRSRSQGWIYTMILPHFTGLLYMVFASNLLRLVDCIPCAMGTCLYTAPDTSCYDLEDGTQVVAGVVGLLGLTAYLPTATMTPFHTVFVAPSLHVWHRAPHAASIQGAKLVLCVLSVFVAHRSPEVFFAGVFIVNGLLAALLYATPVSSWRALDMARMVSFGAASMNGLCALVSALMADASNWPMLVVLIVTWVGAVALLVGIVRQHPVASLVQPRDG